MAGIIIADTIRSSGNTLTLNAATQTVATIDSSGNIKFKSAISVGDATPTTSGAGITFPATQSASSDANTLDDYEEGTWTTTVTSQSGTITTSSFSGAKYTKIGNIVIITVTITITTVGTASGHCLFTLPFTGASVQQNGGYGMESNTNGAMLKGFLQASSSSMQITQYNNASPFALGNGSIFNMNAIYQI